MQRKTKIDYLFTALANMGNASSTMSWANNCVEDIAEVPEELKAEMKNINSEIHRIQRKLRDIRSSI